MLRGPLPCSSLDRQSPPAAPSSRFPPASSPHTRPGKNRLFLNLRRKKAMKKVPAMSTRDRRAVLGWPRGLPCPDGPAELPFPGPSVAPAPAHVVLSPLSASPPLSASELLETEQPWRGCSWKIWKEQRTPSATLARFLASAVCRGEQAGWGRPACPQGTSLVD